MPSNRGLASQLAVSQISDSNELMAGFPATSESNDLMTGSCRSCTATLLAISIPRFCVIQVLSRPDTWADALAWRDAAIIAREVQKRKREERILVEDAENPFTLVEETGEE